MVRRPDADTTPTMYFGTPSPAGKFYKGLSTDTPVNHVRRHAGILAPPVPPDPKRRVAAAARTTSPDAPLAANLLLNR